MKRGLKKFSRPDSWLIVLATQVLCCESVRTSGESNCSAFAQFGKRARVRKITRLATACAIGLGLTLAACSGPSPKPQESTAASQPAAPAVPQEMQSAAESSLGGETEVLVFGDLARNGRTEVLAVNRLKVTPQGAVPGTLVTRAVIIENDGGTWKEVFRCDEHLKNTQGYLGGQPLAPVAGWRLKYEQSEDKGLEMYFTPIAKPQGGYIQPVAVRWNPAVKRYESLDRDFKDFLGEAASLETPQSELR